MRNFQKPGEIKTDYLRELLLFAVEYDELKKSESELKKRKKKIT
jgi:hypothetical protein